MIKRYPYICLNHKKIDSFLRVLSLLILSAFLSITNLKAQDSEDYDEVNIFFSMPKIGGAEIPALIRDNDVYLSVTDVFSFLRIKNNSTPGFDKISGFILAENDPYLIDRVDLRIDYQKKSFRIKKGDLLRTETNLFLKSNYFGEIFGLECSFSFRNLTVVLNTKIELPVIREMRNEQMRKNISQIKGDISADTVVKRDYPFFRFGVADWSLTSTQKVNGESVSRAALSLGSIIAGGELNATVNYTDASPFNLRDQFYSWRYANNDMRLFKQAILGKIASESISTLNSPLIGFQLTNTPTTFRRSYGTYTLSDVTEPGWLVELYVNNILVDYKKADASGFFSFEVPLVYGNTEIKLQFYGPWGEERSKEKSITIPYNFLPKGLFEYTLSGGVTEDTLGRKFSRLNADYGISKFMTLGGGVEYLSSDSSGRFLPFIRSSVRLTSKLIISGEYTYGTRFSGYLNYRLPSDFQIEANYIKYERGQSAINTSYLEERKLSVSMPFRGKNSVIYSKLSLNQYIMPQSQYTAAELLFSGSLFGINTNFTTNAVISDNVKPDVYSTLALSLRLPLGIIITPQSQYNYTQGRFSSVKSGVEMRVSKNSYLTMSYEQNFTNNITSFDFGFRHDFRFAQFNLNARRDDLSTTFTESVNGSILADTKNSYLGVSKRSNAGKGGLFIYPFLDINGNGLKDKGESKVFGLQLQINGGRIEYNTKDTTIRVFDLESYAKYLLTFSGANFDNIAWQLKNKTYEITAQPNQIRQIEVPVSILGEVNGMVYIKDRSGLSGQGRIIVDFFKSDSTLFKSIISEEDGFFSLLGFYPGHYYAKINREQLNKLSMTASPEYIEFDISPSKEGDFKEGIDFTIERNTPEKEEETPVTVIHNQEQKIIINEDKDDSPISSDKNVTGFIAYKIQLTALKKKVKIDEYFINIKDVLPGFTIIENHGDDGVFRYQFDNFRSLTEARAAQLKLQKKGWKDLFILPYYSSDNQISAISDHYSVQLMASKKPIEIQSVFKVVLEKFPNITIEENRGADGLYRYSCGNTGSLSNAKVLLGFMRKLGWYDAFIVSMNE